jgi:hypothetical protein
MRRVANSCLFLLLSTLPFGAVSQSARNPRFNADLVLGGRIAEGVVFAGNLWLRGTTSRSRSGGASGALVALSLADLSKRAHIDSGVLAIEKIGDDLWVLRRSESSKMEWILSIVRNDALEDRARFISADTDAPFALFNDAGIPAVISRESIRVLSGDGEWKSLHLVGQLREGVQVQVASPAVGNSAYIGINRGEWGGGLLRVDLKTGVVLSIERRDTRELCSGPLNSDCDPVTGVIPDPQNKDCVLAAIGLVHFLSRGRILRVCGDQVSVIFEHPRTEEINSWKLEMSDAFYGLASANGGFWAVTPEALYRFGADENTPIRSPLPKLHLESGIYMNRNLPGVIVISTDVNWAVSVSGYTPLVVALDQPQP